MINNIKYSIVTLVMLFLNIGCYSMPPVDYFTSISDGDWNTTTTWDTGTVPPSNQTGGNDDITIDHNVTLTGNLSVKSGTIITINVGDTLIINGDVDFSNGCNVIVNGVLIINGDVINNNNSDGVVINGEVIIDGNYDGGNGSDLGGTGGMDISGSVTTDGDATVFGSTVDCTTDCDNSASSPLPVELIFFNANVDESNYVRLEWLTATEINNNYFDVARSVDNGKSFTPIGSVQGVGNSSTPQFYSFIDTSPKGGYNYYKLIQYDFDGEYEEHNITYALIMGNQLKNIKIYPNPSRYDEDVSLELIGFKGEEVLIIVMNTLGEIFYEKAILSSEDNTIIVIDSKLSRGAYIIVGSEKQELYRRTLIVK